MSKGIPISQKHGVNPCMGVCFFCGEDTGEIALMGRLPNDAEAPRKAVLSYEPCDKCKEMLKERDAVLVVEVSTKHKEGQPPIHPKNPNHFPTGRWVAIPKCDITSEEVVKAGRAVITEADFELMFGGKDHEHN